MTTPQHPTDPDRTSSHPVTGSHAEVPEPPGESGRRLVEGGECEFDVVQLERDRVGVRRGGRREVLCKVHGASLRVGGRDVTSGPSACRRDDITGGLGGRGPRHTPVQVTAPGCAGTP